LIQLNDQIARTQAGLHRIFNLLDTEPSVINDATAPPIPKIEGRIKYDHVWFSYEPEQYVIKDVNLTIEPGQLIAFVGGSGPANDDDQPPLASLRCDKRKADDRRLRSRTINLKSLRDQISVVPPGKHAFSHDDRRKSALRKLNATDEELVEAARARIFIT
jgi:ABC-type multidrug transport system fused ATPase/permease subunit